MIPGASEVTALDAPADASTLVGFHPPQTFSDPDRAIDPLAGATVAIEVQRRSTRCCASSQARSPRR